MSLQQKAYRSAGWSGLSGMISNSLELLKYIVLARLLGPGDFGLLAMAMVIISIGRIFADGGTSNAVIHYRNQTSRQLSTLYWVNILAGFTLYGIVFLAAPLFASFYGEPEVNMLLRLGGVILPIYAAGALYEVMLRKSLSFKYITFAESISAFLGFSTAVALAVNGWGVYSLIWSHIVTASSLSIFYITNGLRTWAPAFHFAPSEVRSHLSFGLFQMGDRGLGVYATRIDQLIIGRFFGPDILGAYHLAYHLVLFPIARLSPLLNRVALPVFSSRQNDDAILRNGYLKLMRGMMSMVAPLLLLAALTAPWLVPLLIGSGWELAIQLIPLMAAVGLLRMLGNPSGNIVLAKGRAQLLFLWNLGAAVVSTIVFLAGAQYSVFMLLWLYIGTNIFYFAAGQTILVNRLIALQWVRFLRGILPMVAVLGASTLAAWLFRYPAGTMLSESNFLMVLAIVTLFLIVYLPLVMRMQSELIREVKQALMDRSEKRHHNQHYPN